MHKYVRIYHEGKFLREEMLKVYHSDIFIYRWHSIEEEGSYSFMLTNKRGKEEGENVTYSHTGTFTRKFETSLSKKEAMKPINGFRKNEDIILVYNKRENSFTVERLKFTRFLVDTKNFGFENPKKVEMPSEFNNWNLYSDELVKIDDTIFEIYLALTDGVYEYKLVIDGHWFPHGENLKLIVGEMGCLFPEGKMGNGIFVYEAKDNLDERKAIKHDNKKLDYLNKISELDIEIKIRTQMNDVENVKLHIIEEDEIEEIYEMERVNDYGYGFDFFRKIAKLRINSNKFSYYFELNDNGKTVYYDKNGLLFEKEIEMISVDYTTGEHPTFDVPDWAKKAVWYNIFPDRFYNGNKENDPIYNELGPEIFKKPKDERANLIEDFRWGAVTEKYGEFERHEWNENFENQRFWEKTFEEEVDYSLKYARMYGGDIQGIKEKIPYLKDLGVTALWLNPVFFADTNHKYGAYDFRHVSPDFGTIKTSGKDHGIKVDKNNLYGNKSYIDVLGEKAKDNSEYKLLRPILKGKNRGKNGYGETEDTSTWVWTESDLIVVDLIKELHKNEIRVIFDGAFNHCGSRHWSFELALAEGENSKYAKWHKFHNFTKHKEITDEMTDEEAYKTLIYNRNNVHYAGWAGFKDLPDFNTYNKEYIDYICDISKKWLLGPDGKESENWMEDDGIDGWRLDVPNCVENQEFWNIWRKVIKTTKKDGYITAELWGDARSDINDGLKYDTVMNYEWLKTTIAYFINQGKEFNSAYKPSSDQFFAELKEKRYWYPMQSLQVSQNLNGSHDTDRLLSRVVNDKLGRDLEEGKQLHKGYNTIKPDLANTTHKNTSLDWDQMDMKPKDILKLISIFQMTYLGAPMLYYGDELGMWGATDPYCRKPMLWPEFEYEEETDGTIGAEKKKYSVEIDYELFEWYKKIIKIRTSNETFSMGLFEELVSDTEKDLIAYKRYDDENDYVVIINNSFYDYENYDVFTSYENRSFIDLLSGNEFNSDPQGLINIKITKKTGLILKILK